MVQKPDSHRPDLVIRVNIITGRTGQERMLRCDAPRRAWHHFGCILAKNAQPESRHEETLERPRLGGHPKMVKVDKDWERLKA